MRHQIPAAAERRTVAGAPRPGYRQCSAEASAVNYVRLSVHASFCVPHFMILSKSVELSIQLRLAASGTEGSILRNIASAVGTGVHDRFSKQEVEHETDRIWHQHGHRGPGNGRHTTTG